MASASLIQKYDEERDKRLRKDTTNQYVSVRDTGIEGLDKDPFIDYNELAAQPPVLKDGDHIKALVVGAGHNGIVFAARLVDAGISAKDVVVVDFAGGWGGVWYWNRYPGLMCDVEGYCYLPLLQETGFVPKWKYSYGEEIRENAEFAAKHYGLQGMFSTKVKSQVWDEASRRWVVTLTQDFGGVKPASTITVKAQFLMLASGALAVPKVPKLDGFKDFWANHKVFHTSRWDYEITGGSQEQPDLAKLADKRVAVVGTGATAIQVIPHVGKWAKHLYVVQRTPSYCGPRPQKRTTPEDWAKVADGPDWQDRRAWNFNSHVAAEPDPVDLVNDGWTRNKARAALLGSNSRIVAPGQEQDHIQKLLEIDTPIAEELRTLIQNTVKDQETADKLKPWYQGWCKRPTWNDDYYETFNRENVSLVDTDGRGIERFTDKGFVVDGKEYEIDILILATGFAPMTYLTPSERLEAPIVGPGGRTMDDWWKNDTEFATLFGAFAHGFPNLVSYHAHGSPISYNSTWSYDFTARLAAHVIAEAYRQSPNPDAVLLEATREAELNWTSEAVRRAGWFAALSVCTPGNMTQEGKGLINKMTPEQAAGAARKSPWGAGPNDYKLQVDRFIARVENKLEGFTVA